MNQINLSTLPLATKSSNYRERIVWPGESAKKQIFSIPDNIIYYMARNPSSPKIYLKLAKSCKYFFEKLPLLVVNQIRDNGKTLCSNEYSHYGGWNPKCCVNIDLTKIPNCKLWLIKEFYLGKNRIPKIASIIAPKFHSCESAKLFLDRCEISWDDFKIFASKFQKFFFLIPKVVDIDGNSVMLDIILKAFSNVNEFAYRFNVLDTKASALTFKNILEFENLDNLKCFKLFFIPEVVEVADVADLIQKYKDTKFYLDFTYRVSDAYKAKLDELVDTVIETEFDGRVVIRYSGQDEEKLKTMQSRSCGYRYSMPF